MSKDFLNFEIDQQLNSLKAQVQNISSDLYVTKSRYQQQQQETIKSEKAVQQVLNSKLLKDQPEIYKPMETKILQQVKDDQNQLAISKTRTAKESVQQKNDKPMNQFDVRPLSNKEQQQQILDLKKEQVDLQELVVKCQSDTQQLLQTQQMVSRQIRQLYQQVIPNGDATDLERQLKDISFFVGQKDNQQSIFDSELAELQRKLDSQTNATAMQAQQNEKTFAQLQIAQQQISKLEQFNNELQSQQRQTASDEASQITDLKAVKSQLELQILQLQLSTSQQKEQIGEQSREIENLQTIKEELQKIGEQKSTKISELNGQKRDLEAENEVQKQQINDLNLQVNEDEQIFKKMGEIQTKNEEELAVLNRQIQEFHEQFSLKEVERENLVQELELVKRKLENSEKQTEEQQEVQERQYCELQTKTIQIHELEMKLQQQETEFQQKVQEVDEMMQEQQKINENLNKSLNEHQKLLQEQKAISRQHESEIQMMQQSAEELLQLNSLYKEKALIYEQELHEQDYEILQHKKIAQEAEDAYLNLYDDFQEIQLQNQLKIKKINELQDEIQQWTEKQQRTQQKLQESQNQTQNLELENQKLQKEVKKSQWDVKELENRLQNAQNRVSQGQQMIEKMRESGFVTQNLELSVSGKQNLQNVEEEGVDEWSLIMQNRELMNKIKMMAEQK